MNKERAINILLDYAKKSCETIKIKQEAGHTQVTNDTLTAAILFMEQDIKKNKKDSKVEIKGLEFKLTKGL